jgi:hypothetical protein
MQALRRWDARRKAPSIRALRDAGPPTAWLAIGGFLGLAAVVVLFVLGVRAGRILVAVPLVAFVLVGILDRDGWRIRMATGELALRQRARWQTGKLPIDPLGAEAWLADNPDASLGERAAVMVTAGRSEEARIALDGATGATPEETVRLARLRLTLDASLTDDSTGRALIDALDRIPEMAALTDEERRYHRLSLAWSLAWLEIQRRRPWRRAFADAIRDLQPFRVALRYRLFHATQHFALPIAYVLAWLIVTWLGLTDRLL